MFTLRGGGILIWSSEGNIDAGKGAKTAVSAPAPVQITTADGQTIFKFQSVAGSGIRTILVDKNVTPGDVDLIAPRGEVNAGDAGIGSAGRVTIAAPRVVGADNIQASGGTSGVVQADSSGLAGSIASLGGLAAAGTMRSADQPTRSLSDQAQAQQALKDALKPFLLTVEVVCTGDECRR